MAAATLTATPLWIPQMLLPIGITLLCLVVARKLVRPDGSRGGTAGRRRLEGIAPACTSSLTVSLGLIVAVALLLGGIQIAIAVGVGGVLTLLLNEGIRLAQRHRLHRLGQRQQLDAERAAAVHPDGRADAALRRQRFLLRRHDAADPPRSRRPAADQHRELLAVRGDQRVERRDRRRHRRCRDPAAEGRRLRPRHDLPARSPPAARSAS